MHLVLNHVTEFQEVCHTYCSRLVEALACLTIIKVCRAEVRQTCLVCPFREVLKVSTVEDRCSELDAELTAGSTEDSLEDLTEVHTRRHAERVQYQVDRTTVLEERHILHTCNLRNDTLVTVTTCELITYAYLTLLCNVYLSHLENA